MVKFIPQNDPRKPTFENNHEYGGKKATMQTVYLP